MNVTFPVKVISKLKPAEKTLTQLVSHCQRALLLWSVYKSHTDKHRVHIYHAQCHIPAENESQQHHTMLTCPEKRGIKTHHVLIFAHYLNCHSWTLVKRTHGRGGKSFRLATDKQKKGEKAWILVLLYFNSSAVSLHPWPLFSVIWNNVRPSLESIHQCRKKLPLTLIKNTICASQGGETERYGSPPPPPHSSSSMQVKLKSSVVIKFKLGLRWGPKTRLRHNRECAERTPHGGSRFTKGSLGQPVPIHSNNLSAQKPSDI